MSYLLVAILQMLLSICKVYEIRWSYEDEVTRLTILSFIMAFVWILGTSIGVNAVMEGDYTMMVVYVVFGGLGKIIAIKFFRQNTYRSKVFKKLNDEKD